MSAYGPPSHPPSSLAPPSLSISDRDEIDETVRSRKKSGTFSADTHLKAAGKEKEEEDDVDDDEDDMFNEEVVGSKRVRPPSTVFFTPCGMDNFEAAGRNRYSLRVYDDVFPLVATPSKSIPKLGNLLTYLRRRADSVTEKGECLY
jgi:hypothetical protein